MIRVCIICGKELIGKQRKLCSNKECHRKWKKDYSHNYSQNNPEYNYEYYQNNQKKILKRSHDYYWNNLEKIERYRQNNSEIIKERKREYRRNNSEKIKKYQQEWRQNNPEYRLEWQQNNSEKVCEYKREYYRRSRGLPDDADLYKESSIERITRGWLQDNGIKFISQYFINLENSTWTWIDFYIPKSNTCLYVDGGYHHLLPDIKKRDENQNRILPQMGYNVIRIAETEILEGNEIWYRLLQYLKIKEYKK